MILFSISWGSLSPPRQNSDMKNKNKLWKHIFMQNIKSFPHLHKIQDTFVTQFKYESRL